MRWGRWHLRTKLVLATMGLLTAICFIVGVVSYTAMSVSLNAQLNATLQQAASRTTDFSNKSPQHGSEGAAPDLLNARGTGVGQLNARISNGTLASAGMLAPDLTRTPLTRADAAILAAVPTDGSLVDRALSAGAYRLTASAAPDGDVIVTGLPLAADDKILAALVWTIVLVSLAGLLALGLAGTAVIRRAMKPLEQLSDVATRVSELPLDAGEVALALRVPPAAANPGTEVGNVGYALNKMLDNVSNALEARQRSETKVRRFVADASHELRTPLTAIRGYTELMRMTERLSPEGTKSLSRVESQSKRMGSLVEDLLLLARLDEGRAMNLQQLDLAEIVMESVGDIQVMAKDHRWRLNMPNGPIQVRGDKNQLRQVMINLLTNAYKHTDPGTSVTASVTRIADGSALVTVTDTGQGIALDFQDKIFDRFARADAARSGTAGTTGLGLSIVDAIVRAHGGRIELTSKPGRTQFAIRLPSGSGTAAAQPLHKKTKVVP
ncbi:sensor histidine kinase [Paenarthrobacter sp. Z7-10]|uniref:sensor histidine kinase n=1 Tax=Paenarthrobacter sp. Z7-10 TaxID=2787635 RepID=UPI0022A94811|nr:HAMP domain-containing sensor histidine kinase [Paenarthrobacter sp. Z7-10]